MADAEPQDAFMYFLPNKIKGESADSVLKEKDAFELTEFTLKAENSTNIGSATGGAGGAGKVKYEKLTIKKKSDSSTTDFFRELSKGTHFDEAVVILRRNQMEYMKFTYKMCVLAEMETTQSGDDEAEDSITVDYGAVKIEYTGQKASGDAGNKAEAMWSRVANDFSMTVEK